MTKINQFGGAWAMIPKFNFDELKVVAGEAESASGTAKNVKHIQNLCFCKWIRISAIK